MDIFEATRDKLAGLGYEVQKEEMSGLERFISEADTILRAKTNQAVLPEGLFFVWADMSAGLFMQEKKALGLLDHLFDFEAPAQKITEGDTSVSFQSASAGTREDQLDRLLTRLVTPSEAVIIAFRRLAW